MDDKKKLEEVVQETPKRGSGSMLSAARKQQNRTVEEIADELNLSVTQIRTIELDQSEGLPEPTYVRGYIRSYARLLGLNVNEVLDHYLNPNWQKSTRLDDMPRGIGSASEGDSGSFFTPGKIVVIILVASILGFLWFTGKFDSNPGGQPATVVTPTATPTANTTASSATTSSDSTQPLASSGNTASEQSAADQPEADSETGVTNTENQLTLTFTDTSWVDIRDGDGNRLAYKNYAEGEDLSVSATTSMSVFIGNATAVSAIFNGAPYDISRYREGVYARFTVGE